jgi:cell division protein FtsB
MTAAEFWIYVVFAALISYFGLAVVIAIGGWFDVWRMLRRLSNESRPPDNGQ